MRKNIQAVFRAFEQGKDLNMISCQSFNGVIYSYRTALLYRKPQSSVYWLNWTQYSRTTSFQQSALAILLSGKKVRYVYDVPYGTPGRDLPNFSGGIYKEAVA